MELQGCQRAAVMEPERPVFYGWLGLWMKNRFVNLLCRLRRVLAGKCPSYRREDRLHVHILCHQYGETLVEFRHPRRKQ